MLIPHKIFLPIYLVFLLIATLERVKSTFYCKRIKETKEIFYKWSFSVLFYMYLLIVIISIGEYFLFMNKVNSNVLLLGVALYALGAYLRRTAIKALGENWSVYIEIKKDHELVTRGIYERMKHPYCVAVVLELIGICLVSNSFIALIMVFLIQMPLLFVRINLEERVLTNHFGHQYKQIGKN